MTSASMTSLLDTLERRNLVQRHPHPTDRRKVLIHLTGQAREIVDQVLPAAHAVITAALSALAEPDREQLLRITHDDPGPPTHACDSAAPDAGTRLKPRAPDPGGTRHGWGAAPPRWRA